MAIMSHSILDKEKPMNKVEKEVNRFKARLARWILKVVYRISTYDGSDSKPVSDETKPVPEQEVKPETNEAPEVQPEAPSETIKIDSFGSPNTSKATEDPNAQIKDLKLNKDGLSYRWAKGGCENLGASSKGDYSQTIAVAGYGDGKTFKCAKFDWISTSRTSRSFENIYDHYNGFDPDAFFKAPHRCFFIMGADGKRRTNILTD